MVRNTGWAKMSRKAKFMLDEHRTPDGDGQAGAGGEEDRVLSPTTNQRAAPRGDLTGSESRRRATTGRARHHHPARGALLLAQLSALQIGCWRFEHSVSPRGESLSGARVSTAALGRAFGRIRSEERCSQQRKSCASRPLRRRARQSKNEVIDGIPSRSFRL